MPSFSVASSPHLKPTTSVAQVMQQVILGLIPGVLAFIYFFGWGVVTNLVIAITLGVLAEAVLLRIRRKPLKKFLGDWSAVVTATLFALTLPPGSPWWLIAVGIGFAMIFGKHIYGGLGYNPFNPAMVGYVVLLTSFPLEMSNWTAPTVLRECGLSLSETLSLAFGSSIDCGANAFTAATPLDAVKTQTALGTPVSQITSTPAFGWLSAVGWEWISLGYLAGGVWLIFRGVIRWHIPLSMLASLALLSGIFWIIDGDQYAGPFFHLFSGASILGAFFIATDPVSASTTPRGRLIFGAGIGVLIFVIRQWGGYPDAVAFAVLLMNLCVPTIDYLTKPRVYGHTLKGPK